MCPLVDDKSLVSCLGAILAVLLAGQHFCHGLFDFFRPECCHAHEAVTAHPSGLLWISGR